MQLARRHIHGRQAPAAFVAELRVGRVLSAALLATLRRLTAGHRNERFLVRADDFDVLHDHAVIEKNTGDYLESSQHAELALQFARQAEYDKGIGDALNTLGTIPFLRGRYK